ncbi:hypothetical protein BCR44DRAFT_1423020 [Catenaria anguillulae PL171]|uniref:MHD2 domain-containing protein n=1 Tax=Catenaria anguillulae PL171 TaxID=765915 RepID=A0A1Y2I5E1_9FUNG|nr:hypothetical protein BCR44DRAFT_1423020 [Catenaria anguillulae PL171]
MDPNPNLGYNYNYPARRESQLSRHGSPHPVPAPASASATASAPARPDRSRSRGPAGANGRGPAILPPKSPRRPVSSNYAPSSSTASAADSSMSTVSSASTTILSPVPSSASSTLFSPRPASAMVPPTGCLPAASSFAASPSVAPSPMPMPRRSLPDLYPYVLRAALWHDRSKLSHGASLHGGGAMTTYVRQVFGVPNDKAKDPAYASVKNRSDDKVCSISQSFLPLSTKHLYRDLNLYLDRLDLNLIPGRRHDDFPAPKSFSAWLNAERDAVISEARSLAARDSKVSKKSKHGTPNPRADTCLFIPPHADDAYATIVRKLANSSARALLDLVATRWRIDPSYRSLLLLDRIATSQLITPPKTGGTCSPQSLRDIDTHLDQLMHLARTSVARWPTAHRAFAQRTHYPEFYQRVHFVPAMAGLVQMITADVAGPAPNVPDALPKLRHAAYVHFRRVLHKAHEESLAQLPEQQDDEAPPASDDPRLFVMHDVDKLKRVHASNSDTSNTALGWSAAHAVLTYELLSKLVAHIDDKVFDVYNTARESAMALGVVHMSGDSMSHLLSRYADWFQSAVDEWIRRTSETMTEQWTRRMIEQDQFGSDGDMLSTSQVDALKALAWPSFDHEYRAAKKFTRTMCQVIAILLQMEEAALAEDAAIEAANSAGSGANSTHASPDRTKSLMHRLRGAFGGDKDKDRSVAGKPLRIDGLYAHLTGVLSSELPEDLYVSPFARDETLDRRAGGAAAGGPDVFWAEVTLDGTPLGRTPTEEGILPTTPPPPVMIDLDSAVLLTVYASMLDGETVTSAIRSSTSMGGLIGVSKTYPHHVGQRRLRVHVRWVRGESRYMYHFFDDAYSQLSVMVGKWMQDYMLQLASTEYGGGESTIVSFKTRAGRKTITFATVEEDMQPLLDYLNHTLEVLNTHLHDSLTTKLFKRVWRGALTSIDAVLRRSLTLLYDFFHVDGEGLPRTLLQSRHYHRLAALLSYYHANTDDLMGMYLSAINSYLSAKVEGLTKRAQRQARSRQASTLTRGASLANFAKLADLSTGPQAASDVSPIHSPFASTKDINEDVHVRERKFRTLRPGSARSGGGGGAVVSAKDFISALAADEPARKRAGAKERRFQGAVSKAMSDSESDDGSDHAFGDDDDDATSLGAPLYTDSGVGFGGSAGSRLASLARQEAIWTILCLRADQAAVVRRILDNMRDEATNMVASAGAGGSRVAGAARGGY